MGMHGLNPAEMGPELSDVATNVRGYPICRSCVSLTGPV